MDIFLLICRRAEERGKDINAKEMHQLVASCTSSDQAWAEEDPATKVRTALDWN